MIRALRVSILAINPCLIACLLLYAGAAGCRSTEKSAAERFASVVISGNTPGQIRDATMEVFGRNGYKTVDSSPGNLVFEKQGSHMNNFVYGSWLSDDPVWIRVKAAIVPAGEMRYRLQCAAYMVRDKDGSTEEQLALTHVHHGAYQKMLDEVAERFAFK